MGYFNLESAVINSRYMRLPHLQINWILIAVFALFLTVYIMQKINVERLMLPGYIVFLVLLMLLLLVGEKWGGSKRWFSTPFGGLQPSEFVKPYIILLFSYIYSSASDCSKMSVINAILLFPLVGLIVLEPDFGTGMVFVFSFLIYYLLAEKNKKRIMVFFLFLLIILFLVYSFGLKPYQKERINAFFNPSKNPDTYYHTQQSITMVASGGVFGKGYQRGLGNLYGYIPADHTDFVLAVFAEEEGFLGMMIFYILWFVLFLIILTLIRIRKGLKKWISVGVFSIFFIQFTINVGMVIGLLPVTGLPLPYFTYGGSSTLSNAIITGLLLFSSLNDERKMEVLLR
ncbi:MAG TPA: FtsW/RodA/SpoVE family cell cycle protein [Thermotogota bacterium]|nr:FtsW/RodA/SpoVE family cell cycle protein [Thermotogota bacterium]